MPRKQDQKDIAKLQFEQGYNILRQHPIFTSLLYHANINRQPSNQCPPKHWAVINNLGTIHVHPTRRGSPEEWVYVLAHCLLHLGFGHFQERTHFREWNAACNYFIAKFLADLKLGTAPEEYLFPLNFANRNEDSLYQEFCERGIPGNDFVDMIIETPKSHYWYAKVDWQVVFGEGLTRAVTNAVSVAAGQDISLAGESKNNTPAQKAKAWFINSYPLLGALATNFEIIEDFIG